MPASLFLLDLTRCSGDTMLQQTLSFTCRYGPPSSRGHWDAQLGNGSTCNRPCRISETCSTNSFGVKSQPLLADRSNRDEILSALLRKTEVELLVGQGSRPRLNNNQPQQKPLYAFKHQKSRLPMRVEGAASHKVNQLSGVIPPTCKLFRAIS